MGFFLYICLTIACYVGSYFLVIWVLGEPNRERIKKKMERKERINEVSDKFSIPLVAVVVITIIGLFYFMKG